MRTQVLVLTGVAMAAASGRAWAAGDAPIVVETYETGERPGEADALLAPVYAELEQRGYLGGRRLADVVRARISGDPGALTPSQVVEAQKAVDKGYDAFIMGNYDSALAAEEKALA